jgi:arginyl-tRNA synthetase
MKHLLNELVIAALGGLQDTLDIEMPQSVNIERARDRRHGDYACNIAMGLAKAARRSPRELAEMIIKALPASDSVASAAVAGPGFINFTLAPQAYHEVVRSVHQQGSAFGRSTLGAGRRLQVEFVSANPTGPLHVGHGRGAAYGASLASLMEAAGYSVHREYYVNDAGRQMDILAVSVWLRYLDLCGEPIVFPSNGYQGDYVWDIAAAVHRERGDALRHEAAVVFADLPPDAAPDGSGDKEAHIDALVARCKKLLGSYDYRQVFDRGLDEIVKNIRRDLQEFGVTYDDWFSERSLHDGGAVATAIERLRASGHTYEKGGALWFRSTDYGDEKDRVLVRENGIKTYFAADIAYHMDKLERGYDRVIDVWGADHHGYVPRVKAALAAMGDDASKLDVLLVQFAVLYRGGEKMQMSTRSGEFVTLRELRQEVGNDAARFFYVLRKCEQHMDFDLDLAKSRSNENPVYYVQYAHARIESVFRQLHDKQLSWDKDNGAVTLDRLTEDHETALMTCVARYPEIIEQAALAHEPHQVAYYLRELATDFHTYYNAHQFLVEDASLRDARLYLVAAVGQTLRNGLALLGVSAPVSM